MSKHGLQIWDSMGAPVLELGPHIIREAPEFAQKIGVIAASWSQAEAHLNCLFAVLLDTTPDEAANHLKKFKNAARATEGARKLASEYLAEEELKSLTEILNNLDSLRTVRNRLQHDVWAKKGNDDCTMFAVHPDQFLAFATNMVSISESAMSEAEKSRRSIELADNFSTTISNGFTIRDLDEFDQELNRVSMALSSALYLRVLQRQAR